MAVYCELDEVVNHLRSKTQSFYEALKRDAIAEQLYTPEGDTEVYFSRSLEKEPQVALLLQQQQQQQQQQHHGKHAEPSPKKKFKAVTFEKCSDVAHMYQFSKEEVVKVPPPTTQSALTRSIKPTTEKDPFEGFVDCRTKAGGMVLTVHTWVPVQHPITLRVIEKATVDQIVVAVLKIYIEQKREPPAILDPKAYLLRIADEMGKADEDYPALDEKQLINKFKDEHFVLCRNGKFSDKPEKPVQAPVKDTNMVIKVNFPDQSYTKFNVKPDTKIADLLATVAKKRMLAEADHFLRLPYAEAPCDTSMTMEQIDAQELTLSNKSILRPSPTDDEAAPPQLKIFHRKSTNAPHPVEDEEPKEIFWYDTLAFAFKSYEVTKLPKKYGKKETTIGVDRDRIAYMSQQKRDSTKSKSHMIRDVVRVALLEKPKQFLIEYVGEPKSYVYEAKSVADAREIVGKIEYLVKTEQNIHKT